MPEPLRVVVLEDNPEDRELMLRALQAGGFEPTCLMARNREEYLAAIGDQPDVILADHTLPHFDSLSALDLLRATGAETPFIIVAGALHPALAVEGMKRGANDCLAKDQLHRLAAAVREAIQRCERRRSAAAAANLDWQRQLQFGFIQCSARLGVWHWNPHDDRLTWNDELYRLFGVDRQTFTPAFPNFLALVHPEDRQRVREREELAVRDRQPFEHEFRIVRPDGSIRNLHGRGGALLDDEGNVREVLGVVVDTTELRLAEQAHARLAAIVECSEDGILSESVDGTIMSWNRAAERIFGYRAEEVIGRPLKVLQPEDFCEEASALRAAVLRGERVQHYETQRARADGRLVWISLSLSPIYDRAGNIIGISRIARDITQRRKAEEMLRDSEERFAACFAQASIGMAITTLGGHLLQVNPALCQMLGYDERELAGMQFQSLVYPEDRVRAREDHGRLLGGKCSNLTVEKRYMDRHGSPIWVQVTVSLIRDVQGRPARFLTLIEDIRARKQAAQALRESEERHRLMFDCNPSPILVSEAGTRRLLAVNPAAVKTYGYSHEELLGMRLDGLRPADGLPPLLEALKLVDHGRVVVMTTRHKRKDGSIFEAEVVGRRLVYNGNDAHIAVVHDRTERLRAEHLERERENLKDAINAMEQVLGVVGHELRTPLAGMMAICEFLLSPESRGRPECETFLRSMNDEIARMSNTVDDLLEAARLNSGRARWNWSDLEIGPTCRDAMETIRPLVDEARVTLRLNVEPGVTVMRGDAGAIRRLALNLLSNARKHTIDGSIDLNICSREFGGARWTEIRISDTGAGIPAEILGRLGEAFALNSGVVGSNYVNGTGLGLAICKGIAEAHGGSIRFDSQPGKGTTVTVLLRADLDLPALVRQKFFETASNSEQGKAA